MASKNTGPIYHAWYSNKQRNTIASTPPPNPGSVYWLDRSGRPVEVTVVSRSTSHGCNTDILDDFEYRGIVTRFSHVPKLPRSIGTLT